MNVCRPWILLAFVLTASPLMAQNSTSDGGNPQPKSEADAALQQGDYAKCIELTTQAIATNPQDHFSYYLRASARVELGQVQRDVKLVRSGIEDSRESLKVLGKLEANYYLPYLYGMTILAQLENRPEHAKTAVDIADSLITKGSIPGDQKANIYYQRAVANMVRRQPEDALKDYQTAVQLSPQLLSAHLGLAETYAILQQPEKAEGAYTQAVTAFPQNALVYNNRGMYLQQRGKTKEAYADFSKAVEIDPKFDIAIINRGFTLLNSGQPGAAEADFNAAMAINPNNPLPYSLRGTSNLARGKVDAALQDYESVVKLDPQNPTAKADIGFAKLFAKDYPGAHEGFDQALKANPNLRYFIPWRVWAGTLAGQPSNPDDVQTAAAKPAEKRDWVDHLVLFLSGQESEQQLLEGAKSKDANTQSAQTCEAYYFIAEKMAQAGNAAAATANYRNALGTNAINLSAYRGAQFALGQFAK